MKKLLLLTMLLLLASCGVQNNGELKMDNGRRSQMKKADEIRGKNVSGHSELVSESNTKVSKVKKEYKENENMIEKKIGNLQVNISSTGAIYQSGSLIGLFTGSNICLTQNEWFLCKSGDIKDLIEKNGKIFFKDILTLQDIQNKNYKPVKKIVYKCNGSLYQTKKGKNVPRYYCKINGKDYLEQYEFIDGNWNKVCIKRLGGKDYFEIKKIGNLSGEDKNVYTALYSKKALDEILEKMKKELDCNELKNMFFVQDGNDIKKKMKQNDKEMENLKNVKKIEGGGGIDKKIEHKTNEIKYVFDFDLISKIGFKYSGYTCVRLKGEKLLYTGDNFDNYLCFKGKITENYIDFGFYFPFQAVFAYYEKKYLIKSSKSLLEICKDVFNMDFTIQGNYCYGYKLIRYSEPIGDGPMPGHYVSYLTIKSLGNNYYLKGFNFDPNYGINCSYYDVDNFYEWCDANIIHKSILNSIFKDIKKITLKDVFLAPKNILENNKINKKLWEQLLLSNQELNKKSFSMKAEKINNLKKISLFFPKGKDIDDFKKPIDLKTYFKENILQYHPNKKITFSKKLNISTNNGTKTYYQFIDPGNISYDDSKIQKLPIKGWYKVYEKTCKDGGKIYGYLYLGNYKTLEKAKIENQEEIKKGDKTVEKKKCE